MFSNRRETCILYNSTGHGGTELPQVQDQLELCSETMFSETKDKDGCGHTFISLRQEDCQVLMPT